MDRARSNYIVCTHPRAGSNYFCELLNSTGQLGQPVEYFHSGHMAKKGLSSKNRTHLLQQFHFMRDHTATPNRIHATKMFWFDWQGLLTARLGHLFEGYQFVFLERIDKLGQAISIRRALQSGQLTSEMGRSAPPVKYDYADIRLRLIRLLRAEQSWRSFFAANRIHPLICFYEDISDRPQEVIDRLAQAVRLNEAALIDPAQLRLKIQRDSLSDEWRACFLDRARTQNPQIWRLCRPKCA